VPQRLPRYLDPATEREAFERKLAAILRATGTEMPSRKELASALAEPGSLRGIPAIGRGTAGAVAGSDPLRALLAKERRNGRRRS
jgi:hypothetical protein